MEAGFGEVVVEVEEGEVDTWSRVDRRGTGEGGRWKEAGEGEGWDGKEEREG